MQTRQHAQPHTGFRRTGCHPRLSAHMPLQHLIVAFIPISAGIRSTGGETVLKGEGGNVCLKYDLLGISLLNVPSG